MQSERGLTNKLFASMASWVLLVCFSLAIVESVVSHDEMVMEQTDDCSAEQETSTEKESEDKMAHGLAQIEHDLSILLHREELVMQSFDLHYDVLTQPPEFV